MMHCGGHDRQLLYTPVELTDHGAQAIRVLDFDVLVLHGNDAFTLEVRQRTADRFELESEIAADFIACHAQQKSRRRVTAGSEAMGQIE
jgi:hypothetical protein